MKKTLLAIVAAVLMSTMPAAQAQWVVIDPTNLVQNIMTAARALEQINNQIRQLQNEAQMLTNQAKNLTSLDFSALNELRSAVRDEPAPSTGTGAGLQPVADGNGVRATLSRCLYRLHVG